MDKLFFIVVVAVGMITYTKRNSLYISRFLRVFDIDKYPQPMQWLLPVNLYWRIVGCLIIVSYSLVAIMAIGGGLLAGMTIEDLLSSWFEMLCFILLLSVPFRILPDVPFIQSAEEPQCKTSIKIVWYVQIVFYTWVILNIYHQFLGIEHLKGIRPFLFPLANVN